MKGLLLKFVTMESRFKHGEDTEVTYELIITDDPGAIIWRRMTKELKDIYQDDTNYGISLKSGLDQICPSCASWGGYRYQYGLGEALTSVDVIYAFIEAERVRM